MSMRRWLVVSLLLVTLLCPAQQRRALFVGVANYPEECGWRKIHADNDISLLESVLSGSFSVKSILDEKATTIILQAFKRGNSVELKKEQGKLVVVEIQRKMKIKASITG